MTVAIKMKRCFGQVFRLFQQYFQCNCTICLLNFWYTYQESRKRNKNLFCMTSLLSTYNSITDLQLIYSCLTKVINNVIQRFLPNRKKRNVS